MTTLINRVTPWVRYVGWQLKATTAFPGETDLKGRLLDRSMKILYLAPDLPDDRVLHELGHVAASCRPQHLKPTSQQDEAWAIQLQVAMCAMLGVEPSYTGGVTVLLPDAVHTLVSLGFPQKVAMLPLARRAAKFPAHPSRTVRGYRGW